jgi:hypothetical protein
MSVVPGQPLVGVDPYSLWADATSYFYMGKAVATAQWLPTLFEVDATQVGPTPPPPGPPPSPAPPPPLAPPLTFPSVSAALQHYALRRDVEDLASFLKRVSIDGFYITPAYLRPRARQRTVLTATGRVSKNEWLGLHVKTAQAKFRLVLSTPSLGAPMCSLASPDALVGGPGRPVIGIIDTAIPFAHQQFRRSSAALPRTQTRVRYLWDQGFAPGVGNGWVEPKLFCYGREADEALLNTRIVGTMNGTEVDEQATYSSLKYPGYATDTSITQQVPTFAVPMPRVTHGGAVLGIAGGDQNLGDAAGEAEIIAVQLPDEVVRDTSGANLYQSALDAFEYILARVHDDAPLVINFSYGGSAGPHDGTTLLERAIRDILTVQRTSNTAIVLPAGNLRGARMHASLFVPASSSVELAWDVPAGSGTPSYMELWPKQAAHASELAIQLVPPRASPIPESLVSLGEAVFYQPHVAAPPVCGTAYIERPPNSLNSNYMALVAVGATDAMWPNQAEPGRWRVIIENRAASEISVNAWIRRNDPTFGSAGRQARFSQDQSSISDDSTLSDIAHTPDPVFVVAGIQKRPEPSVSNDPVVSSYSSQGPGIGAAARQGPTCCAPADESDVQGGLVVPGNLGVGTVRMSGTSVAAPKVARSLVNMLASGPTTGNSSISNQLSSAHPHFNDAIPTKTGRYFVT